MTNYHVTPNNDGTWNVKGAKKKRADSIHNTQQEAIDRSKKLAVKNKSEQFIHGRDGKIRDRNSYGTDPHPPKG